MKEKTAKNYMSGLLYPEHAARSYLISVVGAVFHSLLGGSSSLSRTAQTYIDKTTTYVTMGDEMPWVLDAFREKGKGIIILNHQSAVFSDYLQLFAWLGDDILKKSIFYTGAYNVAMNQREFPDYIFRPATLTARKDVLALKDSIVDDIQDIHKNGGYIFVIPTGSTTDIHAEFKSVFGRMIKMSDDDLALLVAHVHHFSPRGYKDIAKALFATMLSGSSVNPVITQLSADLSTARERKGLNGRQMSDKYNAMFNFLQEE